MITISHLTKAYSSNNHDNPHALYDVSLNINDGDVFGIIGKSGAGKSTLVRCINGLEQAQAGCIDIDGVDVCTLSRSSLAHLRKEVSMIFQHFNLFAQKTVEENVLFAIRVHRRITQEDRSYVSSLLERVGLGDKAHAYPAQLSGGQQQRVAIARALALRPRILLCDEATSALDTLTTCEILKLLKEINQELGVTLVIITHAMQVVAQVCNRVAVLDKGRVVEEGTCHEVLLHPRHAVTQELLSAQPFLASATLKEGGKSHA